MKNVLAVFAFVALFINAGFTQENAYFLNNPVWGCTSSCAVPYPCIQNEQYVYYINGDTTINDLVYKKVFRNGSGEYMWFDFPPAQCSGTYEYEGEEPEYFIRSQDLRMYVMDIFNSEEQLLYDFDLEINDMLPETYNNYGQVFVVGIDSIYTPFGYRMRFALGGDTWADYLIEGIGHSKGLVEPLNQPLECGFELVCYSLENTPYYPDLGQNCSFTVGVEVEDQQEISIFPNPFNNYTTIQLPSNVVCTSIVIYNQMGQLVDQQVVNSSTALQINRNALNAGLYFVQLNYSNGHSAVAKVIVSE